MNLLLRFHDLGQGKILIDGEDIAHVTQDSLRSQVGMVTQGHFAAASLGARQHPLRPAGRRRRADDRGASRAEAHDFIPLSDLRAAAATTPMWASAA